MPEASLAHSALCRESPTSLVDATLKFDPLADQATLIFTNFTPHGRRTVASLVTPEKETCRKNYRFDSISVGIKMYGCMHDSSSRRNWMLDHGGSSDVLTIFWRAVVVGGSWTSSSLNIRRDLRWLPVDHRIAYKLCLTTWKTLDTSQPLYLSELISQYLPSRSLCSSNTNLLMRPPGMTSKFSSRAYSVSAPSTWKSLPAHIRSIDTVSTLKTLPKIPPFPVCLYHLVILCQRLRFVHTIFGAI